MIRAARAALLLAAAPVRAQDALLILDASNAMWGRAEGQPPIAMARR